jgi:hypothetical protein
VPCPYNIILGRDTALPSPLYHSGVTGIDITRKDAKFKLAYSTIFELVSKQQRQH